MKRKFTIILEVIDNEAPEQEDNEMAAISLKNFIIDSLSEIAFDIKDIKVSCE